MRVISILIFLILIISFSSNGLNQEKDTSQIAPKEKRELPKLEIPELTIIGKKAITLPFARKGEIYDVSIFQAPPPDSSLQGERPTMKIPTGAFPKYEERKKPIHLAVEGEIGSFSTGLFKSYLDYHSITWGINGNLGFGTTDGHEKNAYGKTLYSNVNAYSMIKTDNDLLKLLRFSGGVSLENDKYGLFGIQNQSIQRSRDIYRFDVQLGSVERKDFTTDLSLSTHSTKIQDESNSYRNTSSWVNPELKTAIGINIGKNKLTADIHYSSISPDSGQSPFLIQLRGKGEFHISSKIIAGVSLLYANASGMSGTIKPLVRPQVFLRWHIQQGNELLIFSKPEIQLQRFDNIVREIPYLSQGIDLQPEKTTLHLGLSYWLSGEIFTFDISALLTKVEGKRIIIADSGKLNLQYLNAIESKLHIQSTWKTAERTQIKLNTIVQPSFKDGESIQLPMIPLVNVQCRGEYTFNFPVIMWSALEFLSRQNIDLQGTKKIGNIFLLNIGTSTTIIPRANLSLEINNILNKSYLWWENYPAPGRQIMLRGQWNIL